MSETITGIVLNSIDYKDADKLLTIYSLEYGKITSVLKGCKKPNAKLKFAFQPFCFAEFEINAKGDFLTVTNAELKESFFSITEDYSKFQVGCEILKIVNKTAMQNVANPQLFICILKAFNLLANYSDVSHELIYAKFLTEFLSASGYAINTKKCAGCGMDIKTKHFFNYSSGGIVCVACKNEFSAEISQFDFSMLKNIVETSFEALANMKIKENSLTSLLVLLGNIIQNNYDFKVCVSFA